MYPLDKSDHQKVLEVIVERSANSLIYKNPVRKKIKNKKINPVRKKNKNKKINPVRKKNKNKKINPVRVGQDSSLVSTL